MNASQLLLPATMPARGPEGWVEHPDLDSLLEDGPEGAELAISHDKLAAAGYEAAFVALESQCNDSDLAYVEYFDLGEGCSLWMPDPPQGEGWRLVAVYDTEDGPAAMFVRTLGPAEAQS